MTYLDFDLLLERSEEKYKAQVVYSPAGTSSRLFQLPFSKMELENFLLKIGRPKRSTRRVDAPELAAAKIFGASLFKAIFDDQLGECLRSSTDEAVRQGCGLRLKLRMTEVPELADIPWEFMYNPGLDRFLCLSTETPVVRYLDLPERVQPLEVKPPIKLLVMISSPSNYPPLDVEQEWAKLKQALIDLERHKIVELERLNEATLRALQQRLRQQQFHIFHYIGHGSFDEKAQDGVLILEDENRLGRPVSGKYLGTLMRDERSLRLALLNSCEGARTSNTDPFAGAAQSLVQQGIPAVIAMQFEVSDETAITLSREFYAALADGYPVDAALTEARKAIFAQGKEVEWGTPVLYMRSPDGRIFDIKGTHEVLKTIVSEGRPAAFLEVREGTQVGRAYYLQGGSNVIGRDEGLAVSLLDVEASRKHAKISWLGGRYVLEDMESTNGTFLQAQKLMKPCPLEEGDLVRVGMTTLVFHFSNGEKPAPKKPVLHDTKPILIEQPAPPQTQTSAKTARIFLSYKRNVAPDQKLALELNQALSEKHEVFIDQEMAVGTRWAERIEAELGRCDYLIILLSEQSVLSEMVKAEIETSHRLAAKNNGRPGILPVRVAYEAPYPYPLSFYLNALNWTNWSEEQDTPRLLLELNAAIQSGTFSKPKSASGPTSKPISPNPPPFPDGQLKIESPEGSMDPQSSFYIEREADRIALEAIKQHGVTITIKGPRQMGKSSLLNRIMLAAREARKKIAFIDFQLFDQSALTNVETFFRQFCEVLTTELELENRIEEYWKTPLGNSQRCTRYLERYVLPELGQHMVLAMDEVEVIFDTEFRSDFFGMLRSWHNSRATKAAWKQFDLALVTSTEPYQLVANLNQSPFNVGEVIDLPDFTLEQVQELNRRHGSPLMKDEEMRLFALVGGHPYLVRRALYLIANKRIATAELFATATSEHGPFGDHLRYHLFRLYGKESLIEGMRQVLRNNKCPDERIFFRLRGAGLVRREERKELPRCLLYAEYFRENLHG